MKNSSFLDLEGTKKKAFFFLKSTGIRKLLQQSHTLVIYCESWFTSEASDHLRHSAGTININWLRENAGSWLPKLKQDRYRRLGFTAERLLT